MARSVRLAAAAARDLASIRAWLTQPGHGASARRRLTAIYAAMENLRTYPYLHPASAHPGVREAFASGHCVMYELHPDTGDSLTAGDVVVLRIFGPGQSRTGFKQP